METLSVYIPPEYCRILNLETLILNDVVYRFSIVWDNGYYLSLSESSLTEEISDSIIQDIIGQCTANSHLAPYLINRALLPLKHSLIDRAQSSQKLVRIESFINKAAGYTEKDGKITGFFGQGAIRTYMIEQNKEIQLVLKDFLSISENSHTSGSRIVFFLYVPGYSVLTLHAICHETYYSISSLAFCETMQYLSSYQEQKTPLQILQQHNNKSNTGLRKLFGKKL